jgi:hypothetical protein
MKNIIKLSGYHLSKKENQIKEEIEEQTAMKDASLETKQGIPGSPGKSLNILSIRNKVV